MATWVLFATLLSTIASTLSYQLIAPESAALQGGGPWNPPLPRSRGGTTPRSRPRQPRQFDKHYNENRSGGWSVNDDYPLRKPAHGRRHRIQHPALQPVFHPEQPSYAPYPKFMRRASSRAESGRVGETRRSKFDNIPGPGPDDMPDAQSRKPSRPRKPAFAS